MRIDSARMAWRAGALAALMSGAIANACDDNDAQPKPPAVPAGAAFAGACNLGVLDIDAGACTGFDKYTACAIEKCDLNACAQGSCRNYIECLADAGDPCKSSCVQQPACTCIQGLTLCAIENCLETLSCAQASKSGGACAALEACCAIQPDAAQSLCMKAVSISRVQGDMACQQLLDLTGSDANPLMTVPCSPPAPKGEP